MGSFFSSLKSFFDKIDIKKACLSSCCIQEHNEVIHNETIIIKEHKHKHKHKIKSIDEH